MFYFFPLSFLVFVVFLLSLPLLFFFWFFHLISFSFQELGMTPQVAFLLLILTLFGSGINIPLSRYRQKVIRRSFFGFFEFTQREIRGIAINFGGALVPLGISIYLFLRVLDPIPVIFALLFLIIISKIFSRVVPFKGVVIPAFIPPIFAALFSLILAPENPAPCAYIAGTLGTLIGADLLNLPKIKKYSGIISIGGAGVFDGIFLSGIVAVFLTAL